MATIGIVGAGAFGTALACVMRRCGHEVRLWAREPQVVASINGQRMNPSFLAGVELAAGITATGDLARAAEGAALLLLASPAQHMRAVAQALQAHLAPGTPVVSCAKGVERGTLALMPEVLGEALPGAPVGVLSGPSFAREIAADLPCGVALACAQRATAAHLARLLASARFCVYPSDDLVGVALGGVMKNVIAIASGIAAVLTEGAYSAAAVAALARRLDVPMPITFAIEAVLSRAQTIDAAIAQMLALLGSRP